MEMVVPHMCRIPGSGGCWHESEQHYRYGHRRGLPCLAPRRQARRHFYM